MGKPTHLRWALIPLSVALTVVALHETHPVHADQAPPPALKTLKLGEAQSGTLYAMTVAIKVPPEVFGRVAELFSDREVAELTAVAATYNMVSRFLVALEIG